jgi:hypothetical protein
MVDAPHPLLAQLTRVLGRTEPRSPIALRLCLSFCEIVVADGGSITLGFTSPDRITLCTTDDAVARVEDAQDVLREGPGLDVVRTGVAVTGLSLGEQRDRWPMLSEMLDDEGAGPLFLHAFPLRPDDTVLGAVCVYQTSEGPLGVSVEDAQFLANALGVALLGHLDSDAVDSERWGVRDRIDQATGMVVAQLRVEPRDALAVLRAHAFAHATTVATVSRWVLDRQLDFSDTESGDETTS